MKRLGIIIALLLQFSLYSQTYVEEQAPRKTKNETGETVKNTGFSKDNLRFGGNLGAAFGTITSIEISPTVGYVFSRMFIAGVGLNYFYYSAPKYQEHIYGGQIFAQFHPIRNIFLHAEYGLLNHDINFTGDVNRQWVSYPLVGGGIALPMGSRSAINLMILWNLNDVGYSLYSNPIIRMGVAIGI